MINRSLHSKKVLVIGGFSGIGLAIAKQAIEAGANVVIASRSEEKLHSTARGFASAVATEIVDVTSEDSVVRFFEKVGNFDHLAITIKPTLPSGSFAESDLEKVRQAFDVKFWGQYRVAKMGLRTISRDGSIVLTSGIASRRSFLGYSIVSSMNAATEALAKAVAVEAAPIRVNVVCPGFVEADHNQDARLNYAKAAGAKFPLDRLARHEEVASAYLYLFANTYASGTTVVVDGATSC